MIKYDEVGNEPRCENINIKANKNLYDRLKKAQKKLGFSSLSEMVRHVMVNFLDKKKC